MAKISLLIEEGQVKAVEGIPVDMYVDGRSYDIEQLAKESLARDENGRACAMREWRAPE
jgi:hypothetical protein